MLIGLVIAVSNLDEVVRVIRASANAAAAREQLLARDWDATEVRPYLELVEAGDYAADVATIRLTDAQVKAILDLRLSKLTALGREEIGEELEELAVAITGLLEILADRVKLYAVLRAEIE